jgi:hypothetical protein
MNETALVLHHPLVSNRSTIAQKMGRSSNRPIRNDVSHRDDVPGAQHVAKPDRLNCAVGHEAAGHHPTDTHGTPLLPQPECTGRARCPGMPEHPKLELRTATCRWGQTNPPSQLWEVGCRSGVCPSGQVVDRIVGPLYRVLSRRFRRQCVKRDELHVREILIISRVIEPRSDITESRYRIRQGQIVDICARKRDGVNITRREPEGIMK